MIGKIITAAIGAGAAKETSKIDGTTGAALGFIAPMVLRRLSLPAMIAIGVGGYAWKKLADKGDVKRDRTTTATPPKTSTAAHIDTAPATSKPEPVAA